MRVLVTGDRRFNDRDLVAKVFEAVCCLGTQLYPHGFSNPTVIHGAASGLDSLASEWTKLSPNWSEEPHPADWNHHTSDCPDWHHSLPTCKMAGHRRNAEMIAASPDIIVGFPLHVEKLQPGEGRSNTSRGTWGTITAARRTSTPTFVLWNNCLWSANEQATNLLQPYGDPSATPLSNLITPF